MSRFLSCVGDLVFDSQPSGGKSTYNCVSVLLLHIYLELQQGREAFYSPTGLKNGSLSPMRRSWVSPEWTDHHPMLSRNLSLGPWRLLLSRTDQTQRNHFPKNPAVAVPNSLQPPPYLKNNWHQLSPIHGHNHIYDDIFSSSPIFENLRTTFSQENAPMANTRTNQQTLCCRARSLVGILQLITHQQMPPLKEKTPRLFVS